MVNFYKIIISFLEENVKIEEDQNREGERINVHEKSSIAKPWLQGKCI